jgi:hypothetical protein
MAKGQWARGNENWVHKILLRSMQYYAHLLECDP